MLENLIPPTREEKCKLVAIADTLQTQDRAILLDALADKVTWSNNGLAEALTKRGIKVSAETIRRHRRQYCPCRKEN